MPVFRISVERRLRLLLVGEAVVSTIFVLVALLAVRDIQRTLDFAGEFVLAPVAGLAEAKRTATMLGTTITSGSFTHRDREKAEQLVSDIRKIHDKYRADWQVAENPKRGPRIFRERVQQLGRGSLVEDELASVTKIGESLDRLDERLRDGAPAQALIGDATTVRSELRSLLKTNVGFVQVAQILLRMRIVRIERWVLLSGFAGMVVAALLGLHVWRAIAPRIRRLVDKVRRFQEQGINDRVSDEGSDEIAILAGALDVGFESIASRDRQRDQFLAVAAHEIKTPLTSILGFAQAALANPGNVAMREQALAVIGRHATRLGRLVEDLLLAASARSGQLRFHPARLDLAGLLGRMVDDAAITMPSRVFERVLPLAAPVIADEGLLGHALWGMLSYASAIADPSAPVQVTLAREPTWWRIELRAKEHVLIEEDWESAFVPFALVQYEDGNGTRAATGLFLCREVARLHGGRLRVVRDVTGITLRLELPG